jgi:hypothetical protein
MDSLTVSSSMLIPSAANVQITPAMLAVLWGMADELDRRRIPATIGDAVWLEIPSKRLRDPDGRNDNFWLRECLDRLTGIKLNGEYRGDPWGAVVLAEWQLTQGGSMCRLLVPPAAIHAIRAPATFAKIEITAAYKLKGHARRLYAALADKKRMGKPYWTFTLDELRAIFDCDDKYPKWAKFSMHVLQPAIDEINDYGTVAVTYSLIKSGRAISGVRFEWQWKSIDDARETDEENERHASARRKTEIERDAPPLYEPLRKEGSTEDRKAISERILREHGVRPRTRASGA